MTIDNIALTTYGHYELFTFATNIKTSLSELDLNLLNINVYYSRMTESLLDFDKVINRNKKEELTQAKEEADIGRDNCQKAFNAYVDLCRLRPDQTIKEAADTIMEIVNRYGRDSYRSSRTAQTGILENLFTEFESEQIAPLITAIGADGLLTELKNSQVHFMQLHAQFVETTEKDGLTLLSTRTPLEKNLRNLLDLISLLGDAAQTEEWNTIIFKINNEIEVMKRSQKSSSKNPDTENETAESNKPNEEPEPENSDEDPEPTNP
jgi:hypothetical protein